MSTDCDHLVMFEEYDSYDDCGLRRFARRASELTEGFDAEYNAHNTAELAPDPDEYIFTFCPNCGARIDWEAIRAWAKAYIDKAEQERKAKMQEEEDRHMAEVRNIRAASFGDVLPP